VNVYNIFIYYEVFTMSDFDSELDATGLNCPLPILRAKKAISAMEAGQTLRIIATDPGSVKDFEAFCKQTGNELLSSGEEDGKFTFMIKKAA
jgi:tRNA 2-thiouridine synthesizing protein A